MDSKVKTVVIVGGGVAGLSALNRLADLGIRALLIEGGSYPSHKICGEFFSPESLPILKEWGIIPPSIIKQITFITPSSSLQLSLPREAHSQSRFDFDHRLAKRAEERGARLLTKTKLTKIDKGAIHLDSGEVINYSDLIISAGRFFGQSPPHYFGIKGHMRGLDIEDALEMFSFPGGYAGLSPIGDGYANFAALVRKNTFTNQLQNVFRLAPHLKQRLARGVLTFDDWMVCPVPAFGMKKTPNLERAYFIGDAAGTIPPASGLGLSLAITSGYMVADYVLKGDFLGFQKAWQQKYRKVFAYGFFLHQTLMNPLLACSAIKVGQLIPAFGPYIFNKTRIRHSLKL